MVEVELCLKIYSFSGGIRNRSNNDGSGRSQRVVQRGRRAESAAGAAAGRGAAHGGSGNPG